MQSEKDPETLTGHRVFRLEGQVDTLVKEMGDIKAGMSQVLNIVEKNAAESTAYRRKAAVDFKCLHDSVIGYKPTLDAIQAQESRRKERSEKIKTHVIGWGVVTGISGAGYALWEVGKAALKQMMRNQ